MHFNPRMLEWINLIVNFVFFGSKSVLSSKNKPFVCGVHAFSIPDENIEGRIFYPSKRSILSSTKCSGAYWFTHPISDVVYGKLVMWMRPEFRSKFVQLVCAVAYYLCKLIPRAIMPRIPNTFTSSEIEVATNPSMPLVIWSHGRGGNVHDHALLLSQLAVEVPCFCVSITHTDGSADTWFNSCGSPVYFRHSKSSGQDERHLEETVEMQEYQIQYRIRELESVVNHLRTTYGIACDKKIVGGFDMGGATALLAAEKLGAVGVISLDGQFALADRFRFPRSIFEDGRVVNVPSAFMLSDEWQVWNRAVTDNTKSLSERCPDSKLITVKQTKHNNFIECMYWIPQIFLIFLRLSGIIHRRASPRKSYRRTVKWLVALVQQYTSDEAKTRSYSS